MRPVRNADGLRGILEAIFGVRVEVTPFAARWMELAPEDRTTLGTRNEAAAGSLGGGAVLGRRVWDRQHAFRLTLGPLTLQQYESFLPTGAELPALVDWVRLYFDLEFDWDARLLLAGGEVPRARLGAGVRLGWTAWLGSRPHGQDAGDLYVRPDPGV